MKEEVRFELGKGRKKGLFRGGEQGAIIFLLRALRTVGSQGGSF